jgi:Ca2+-binding RTX toxin-like protein
MAEPIIGTNGSDTLIGDEGNDLIIGNRGGQEATPVQQTEIQAAGSTLPSLDAMVVPASTPPAPITPQGDDGDNVLTGTAENETIRGGLGNDIIDGGLGNDIMRGGFGDDQLIWNPKGGNDRVIGGAGNDESLINAGVDSEIFELKATDTGAQFARSGDKPFTVDTDTEAIRLNALDGDDQYRVSALDGTGVEAVRFDGGAGNDLLDGSAANTTLVAKGGKGNDTLLGGTGDDVLRGNAGNDTFNTGAGDDVIRMGQGQDRIVYDSGDVFNPEAIGQDLIKDFEEGDKIVLDKTTFQALTSDAGEGFSATSDFAVVDDASQVDSNEALIVYDKGSGSLFYNSNRADQGLGRGGEDAFAIFADKPDVQADDFIVQA